jgi:hypothetical protein
LEAVLRQVDTTSKNLQFQSTNLNSNFASLQSSSAGCGYDISNDPTWKAINDGSAGLETSLASLAVGVSTTVTTLSDIVSAGSGQFVVSNLGRNVFAGAAAGAATERATPAASRKQRSAPLMRRQGWGGMARLRSGRGVYFSAFFFFRFFPGDSADFL